MAYLLVEIATIPAPTNMTTDTISVTMPASHANSAMTDVPLRTPVIVADQQLAKSQKRFRRDGATTENDVPSRRRCQHRQPYLKRSNGLLRFRGISGALDWAWRDGFAAIVEVVFRKMKWLPS